VGCADPEGRLHLANNPKLLAGSAQMLTWSIHHLVSRGLTTLAQAWEMASVLPAKAMNFSQNAGLNSSSLSDVFLFTHNDQGIRIEKTMKAGEMVFER
jgi:N-acetylglucosamine-6-phosphate deacetylase